MNRRQILFSAFALVLLSHASGCGDGRKRIIIMTNGNSPYWDACRVGMEAAEKELDLASAGLKAVMVVNDGTPAGQIEKLRQYATQPDVVAVGVSVTDAKNAAIAAEMRKLREKGIPVLAIDGDVDRAQFRDARLAFVGTDNLAAGVELGKAIQQLRPEGGEFVTFVGRTGAQNAMDRVAGVAQGAGPAYAAKDNMGDEMDLNRARDNVRNALTNHPQARVLVGIWSYNGPAIADVIREKNRRAEFTLVTFDAEPRAVQQMADGALDCLIVQNPYDIGFQGVRLMKALVTKDEATQRTMLPRLGQTDGDLYITGLKLVVPDEGSLIKADSLAKSTEYLRLGDFKAWLAKYGLNGS